MAPFCEKNAIKLLCYGVLLGGFLSEKYLGADEPYRAELDTASLQKYKNMIDAWGGWSMFQELLDVLDGIAKKHDTSIANVGTRYVLDKPAVGATIIGARLGLSEHIQDNLRVFSLKLDTDDNSEIKSVTSKANDLFDTIGDCGDEYR
jgi:aryl-alcohol dehydrogenase-like predicted oxidoreductase